MNVHGHRVSPDVARLPNVLRGVPDEHEGGVLDEDARSQFVLMGTAVVLTAPVMRIDVPGQAMGRLLPGNRSW